MSGWSADNPENVPPPTGAGWSDAPTSAAPPSDAAWALPEVGLAGPADPDASAPGPATPRGAGGATPNAAGWDDSPEPVAPPVLPVVLGPMTFTDIVDGAWGIIKARPKTVLAITAMILLPTEILAAYLAHGQSSLADLTLGFVDRPGTFRSQSGGFGAAGVYLGAAVHNVALFFLGGAIARLVSSWYGGGDMTAREAVVASLRKAPALLGAFAVLVPIKLLGWATCGIGLIFLLPVLMVTAPAIVIEDLGPIAGPLRSFALARRRYWRCVGVWALAIVIEITVNVALSVVPALIAAVTPGSIAPVVTAAGTVFAAFVSAPFVVGVAVLLYLDLRVRTEGLDLELDATAAFARAA